MVVPFAGSPAALAALTSALTRVELGPGDTLTVVDNGSRAERAETDVSGPGHRVVAASEIASSYYARNRGASGGGAEWLVFLDADVVAPCDILARYFEPPPGPDTGVLVGAVDDEAPPAGSSAVESYVALTASMSQANTWRDEETAYAQTANCAVRRVAFEAVGGFRDDVRSGGDADLCFRLRTAGWRLEPRRGARVVHRNRATLRALVRQRARHGSGAAWLTHEHPGSMPPRQGSWLGLTWWSARRLVVAGREVLRGERDEAVRAALDPVSSWAFELGRSLPNAASRRDPASRGPS